ncbi:hypothetical protein J6590_095974, partial [Homalodisca vitripennis]
RVSSLDPDKLERQGNCRLKEKWHFPCLSGCPHPSRGLPPLSKGTYLLVTLSPDSTDNTAGRHRGRN